MKLIYLHGLDSSPTATKAQITKAYGRQNGIPVTCPDLNIPPDEVIKKVLDLLTPDTVLIGSSLGGYFANLISDSHGVPAVLLNPSNRPDMSLQRFLDGRPNQTYQDDTVIYSTEGKWDIVYGDLAWFRQHSLRVVHPHKIGVLLKLGDELLDATLSERFYSDKGATVISQSGGDHLMSDYDQQVGRVFDLAQSLLDG